MPPQSPATVLCIDDQETGVAIRRIFLETFGYRVLTANSGQQGIEVAETNSIDAVILDFRMPDMNGDEVARRLRSRQPDLPIVMLTGYIHDLPDSTRETVDAIVTKGSPPTELLDALQRNIGSKPQKSSEAPSVEDHVSQVRKQIQSTREFSKEISAQTRKVRKKR